MKGKSIFTQKEIDELKRLITLRVNSCNKNEKKKLRNKMRRIGFYGRDDWGIIDNKVSDLDNLIILGKIKVIGNSTACDLQQAPVVKKLADNEVVVCDFPSIEKELIKGDFESVSSLSGNGVPDKPGIYCIKLREGSILPSKFGKIREDRIIYIGIASKSLRKRLWEEELNHKRAATFFRSIGAILGYLPPKGSLYGKKNQRNYKFSQEDTDEIRKWMRQSLRVNYIWFEGNEIKSIEEFLIKKYMPLMNIENNPQKNKELEAARERCREYARSI